MTGIPWRTTWKYGPRGYRHLFWDAGAIVANALTAAPGKVVTGFVDAQVTHLLGLDAGQPFREHPLVLLPIGTAQEPAPAEGTVEQLDHHVEPLSREVREEPELETVHRAGDLGDDDAVEGWRVDLRGDQAPPVSLEAPSAGGRSVEEVILQRGSTRRFDLHATVRPATLRWGLAAAPRRPPADVDIGVVAARVTVHAVSGVEAGAYRWTPQGLQLLRAGHLRRLSAHLCLDQALGGTSAFTTFLAADLDALVEVGGARGYRLPQLAAGIAAARLQLAAFTLEAGATGLTFYDEKIRAAVGGPPPMLVAAVGVPDYRPRPGRRPARS